MFIQGQYYLQLEFDIQTSVS